MKTFGNLLRLGLCGCGVAIVLSVPASSSADPNVNVINTPLPVQGTVNVGNFPATQAVSGSVGITGTPNVNVVNTPTVNLGKPSELVTVTALSGSATCSFGFGLVFDTVSTPTGATAPLSIPSGQVLVITEVEAEGKATGGQIGGEIDLFLSGPGGGNLVALHGGVFDAVGGLQHDFHFLNGLVVKSGVALCLSSAGGGPVAGVAHGYFAADQ